MRTVCGQPMRRLVDRPPRRRVATASSRVAPALVCAALFVHGGDAALADGTLGHLAAGRVAESLLCATARRTITALTGDDDLGATGLWADRARRTPRYEQTAAWHYMNIEDGRSITDFEHPPEGDVLWAIADAFSRVQNADLSRRERLTALRLLVHFVVDIHQPLHIGRASDRGGNTIEVRFGGEVSNLHRFWDTDALVLGGWSPDDVERAVAARVETDELSAAFNPAAWAAEGLALRGRVYDFPASRRATATVQLTGAYLDFARDQSLTQLAKAAARLAGTLNGIYCEGE
jgi:hypothetical protein